MVWGLSSVWFARVSCSVATCAGMWANPAFDRRYHKNAGLLNKFVLSCEVDGKERESLLE